MVITTAEFAKALGTLDGSLCSTLIMAQWDIGDVLFRVSDTDIDPNATTSMAYNPLTVVGIGYKLFDDGGTVRMESSIPTTAATSASQALMPWFFDLQDAKSNVFRQIHQSLLQARTAMDSAVGAVASGDWPATLPLA